MTGRRIAFDARYINDRYHGIGRYAYRLLEALVSAAPQHTFVIFRGQGRDSRFDWDALAGRANVEFQPGPWPLYWPQEQLNWPGVLRRSRADLFHSPYFVTPLLSSIPAVLTVHDLIFDRFPLYMPWGWSRPYYRLLMAWGIRRARRVIAVSQATATELGHYYRISPDRVVVISEGADPTFRPIADSHESQSLRQRYHLNRPFIMTTGARRPHKNQARLVNAFARLAGDIGHDLVFAGPPDERFPDQARLAAQHHGLNGRVKFLDWVPEADLPGLYGLADLVVLPSLVEGFGLPALEAMACGTPVVASNGSSLPEVVGEAGVLVNPLDEDELTGAIGRLLHDAGLRQRLSLVGRQRAALFTWENAARQVLQVYDEIFE